MKGYYELLYASKHDKLEETDKFLEKIYKLIRKSRIYVKEKTPQLNPLSKLQAP
jgi:hypothetical protein